MATGKKKSLRAFPLPRHRWTLSEIEAFEHTLIAHRKASDPVIIRALQDALPKLPARLLIAELKLYQTANWLKAKKHMTPSKPSKPSKKSAEKKTLSLTTSVSDKMPRADLVKIAKKYKITVTGKKKPELVNQIRAAKAARTRACEKAPSKKKSSKKSTASKTASGKKKASKRSTASKTASGKKKKAPKKKATKKTAKKK
jgi:hypothetical protein